MLDFFKMWVFLRTSMNFAHLASFQAIKFVDWPGPKTLNILFMSDVKTTLLKPSILKLLFNIMGITESSSSENPLGN